MPLEVLLMKSRILLYLARSPARWLGLCSMAWTKSFGSGGSSAHPCLWTVLSLKAEELQGSNQLAILS